MGEGLCTDRRVLTCVKAIVSCRDVEIDQRIIENFCSIESRATIYRSLELSIKGWAEGIEIDSLKSNMLLMKSNVKWS